MSDKIKYNTIQTILTDLKRKLSMDRDETVKGQYTFEKTPVFPSNPFHNLNTSLDMIPQLFYRNLEGDNMLATREFGGRVRARETPIKIVDIDGAYYILSNMPYIRDLVDNPTNWMFGLKSADVGQGINYAIKILTSEYIGNYVMGEVTHTDCCKITINSTLEPNNTTLDNLVLGESAYILSFLAGGLYLKGLQVGTGPAFVASGNTARWDGEINAVAASWKCSDGTYRAIIGGYAASLPNGLKYPMKLMSATDRLGEWTLLSDDTTDTLFNELIPDGFVGYSQAQQVISHPYKKGMYLMFIGLATTAGTITKYAILEFDEYVSKKRMIDINLDYTPDLFYSTYGYGVSIAFYKGNFLVCIHDGTHKTGKRVVLKSKWLDGDYTIHSTMFDFSTQDYLSQHGSLFGESIPNSSLFVFNNELYAFVAGQPKGGFLSAKLEYHLLKYNDAENEWHIIKGPVIIALHGDDNNYPEYPAIANQEEGAYGGWAKSHMGQINLHYVEDNKLWIGYSAQGWKLAGWGGLYHSTIGYIDLDKALS